MASQKVLEFSLGLFFGKSALLSDPPGESIACSSGSN
jgi:hypothetical protein